MRRESTGRRNAAPSAQGPGALPHHERIHAGLPQRCHAPAPVAREGIEDARPAPGVDLHRQARPVAVHQLAPPRDERGEVVRDRKGRPKPDKALHDTENIPLTEDVDACMVRKVLPYTPMRGSSRARTKSPR